MKTAIIVIATSQPYIAYATELIESIHEHLFEFDPHVITFTDNPAPLQTLSQTFFTEKKGHPKETLSRFHTILSKEHILEKYDQLFYVDADMKFVNDVKLEEIYSGGLMATLHPGFYAKNFTGTPETSELSTAYCPNNIAYYCGGFQGGNARAYLNAAKILASKIDVDNENGVVAKWWDESHWNALLANRLPDRILTPSFCYPEDYHGEYGWPADACTPKLVCLDKSKRYILPRYNNA